MNPINRWVTTPRPNERATLRAFVFPYAGSGATAFRTWLDHIPDSVELCPVQLPGRETRLREAPLSSVFSLAEPLADAIATNLDKPFAFIGHSMGALIAFELARELRRRSAQAPLHLFVSGRVAPHVSLERRLFHNRAEPDLISGLLEMGGTPREVLENQEMMKLLIPIIRADFQLNETYVCPHEPPLDCPISAFAGARDTEVRREQLEAWRIHTTGYFQSEMFPGGHFFLREGTQFLERVSRDLDRIARSASASRWETAP